MAEPAPFPLKELLEEVTEEMQSLAKEGQVVHCRYTGDTVLFSDRRLVKNILINLLSNAIKFSADGAPIQLQAEHRDQGDTALNVCDKGIGISPEDRQHLFSSFFRGGNALNIEGSGLGLHIVRRYLDLLQGTVSLESKLGEGTCVTVIIPGHSNDIQL